MNYRDQKEGVYPSASHNHVKRGEGETEKKGGCHVPKWGKERTGKEKNREGKLQGAKGG